MWIMFALPLGCLRLLTEPSGPWNCPVSSRLSSCGQVRAYPPPVAPNSLSTYVSRPYPHDLHPGGVSGRLLYVLLEAAQQGLELRVGPGLLAYLIAAVYDGRVVALAEVGAYVREGQVVSMRERYMTTWRAKTILEVRLRPTSARRPRCSNRRRCA